MPVIQRLKCANRAVYPLGLNKSKALNDTLILLKIPLLVGITKDEDVYISLGTLLGKLFNGGNDESACGDEKRGELVLSGFSVGAKQVELVSIKQLGFLHSAVSILANGLVVLC